MKHLRSIIAIYFLALFWAAVRAEEAKPEVRTERAYLLHFVSLADDDKGLERGAGTAFPIAPHQLLTAGHCAEHTVSLAIKCGDAWCDCKVLYRDEELDIALLECPSETFTPLELTQETVAEGKIEGCPDGKPVCAIAFITIDIFMKQSWMHTVFTKNEFMPGSSGSPLLTMDNKCIGIALMELDARSGKLCGFLPTRRIVAFLNEYKSGVVVPEKSKAAEVVAPPIPETPKPIERKQSVIFR